MSKAGTKLLSPLHSMSAASFSIFGLLTQQQFENLSKHFEILHFNANTSIYQQMDYTENIYGVIDGMVKTGIITDTGKVLIKNIVNPGNFFGITGLAGQQHRSEFAQSLNAYSTVLSVPIKQIRMLMRENDLFLQAVVQLVGKALCQAENRLEMLLTSDVRTRIMSFLKEQVKENTDSNQIETMLRFGLTQHDIAQMIGATRQTVAIILNEMRKENLIDFSRKKFVIKSLSNG